ncbi:hypothetical protein [Microbacterium sp. B19]|uniref:hypothetical protein n=1 Tax=Microbacterium sp. B19 TaxID=96765 RepID=UPI000345DFB7|nr:hypothetical protein [Microbacterium sp. B19]
MTPSRRLLAPTLLIATALLLTACVSEPTTPGAPTSGTVSPSATASGTTASPTSSGASPSPTSTTSAAFASCDDMITPEFRAQVTQNGWVGWNMAGDTTGHSPFDQFPDGAPKGQLSCRFGAGPDVPTDNVLDLAWAPIDSAASRAAQDALETRGFQRIEVPAGVEWALRGDEGWADDEGWGQTFLFTGTDVRWAMIRNQLDYIKPAA